MVTTLPVDVNSYSVQTANSLLINVVDSVRMNNQANSKNREKTWTVVRQYTSQFSCAEAVERLVKIHSNTSEVR